VEKQDGKRQLVKSRHRWVHNIKLDLGEIGWGGIGWIGLAHDKNQCRALVSTVMNLWVIKFGEVLE
jgi:hypothetical protein